MISKAFINKIAAATLELKWERKEPFYFRTCEKSNIPTNCKLVYKAEEAYGTRLIIENLWVLENPITNVFGHILNKPKNVRIKPTKFSDRWIIGRYEERGEKLLTELGVL